MNASGLATLDLVIIGIYLLVVVAIGIMVTKRDATGEDLFLAGRSLRWPMIGGSLFASNISSTTLIGLAGAAYASGIAVANYEWMAGVVLVLMAVVFIPIYLKARITTVPEYLEKRFSRNTRLYFSGITILLTILVDTAGGIYAGAVVARTFFPDLILWQTCIVLALFAGLYTVAGGLKAVVFTDVLQTAVLILGSTVLTVIVLGEYDFSWAKARETIPEGHLSLFLPLDSPTLPWLGTLIGVPVLGFWYWATNQYITQRVLGARSIRDAQWGANLAGLLKLLPLFIMVLPGAMAIGLFPDLENGDRVFPTLVVELLPVGLTGLVLAGLVAAIMSSIDSTLNSASTLIVKDFIETPERPLEPHKTGRYGRITTLCLMIFAALWAPQIANFGGLFDYLQQAFSILVPPVTVVFLFGALSRRGAPSSALITLVVGHIGGLGLFLLTDAGIWPYHFTINVGIMAGLCAILFLILDRAQKVPAETDPDLVYRPEEASAREGEPFYQSVRLQSAVVLALTAIMAVAFW